MGAHKGAEAKALLAFKIPPHLRPAINRRGDVAVTGNEKVPEKMLYPHDGTTACHDGWVEVLLIAYSRFYWEASAQDKQQLALPEPTMDKEVVARHHFEPFHPPPAVDRGRVVIPEAVRRRTLTEGDLGQWTLEAWLEYYMDGQERRKGGQRVLQEEQRRKKGGRRRR